MIDYASLVVKTRKKINDATATTKDGINHNDNESGLLIKKIVFKESKKSVRGIKEWWSDES